jgi:protein-tyrosine phosphatase
VTVTDERHVRLAGTRNLRDVGGYPAGRTRRTKWRTLFRSDALDQLPPPSQAELVRRGLRLAIDLRWPTELETAPSVFRSSPHVRYVAIALLDDAKPPPSGVRDAYFRMIDDRGPQLAAVVRSLLQPDSLPAVVGCAAGVDRTGMTIALILAAVGVPDDVIAADYALSVASYEGDGRDAGLTDWRAGIVTLDCRPEYMADALERLQKRHGGAAGLLASNGVSAADLDRLRELLTEPSAS